ncbi:hypothetical protein [Prescottella subtropica]|uniref:hypothetical protein n=1 Tax=Prescottella subtropica TaxID=2545757 RepID=UPI0010FA11D5|nr:hypothetical protein [Prescottella subtropica]
MTGPLADHLADARAAHKSALRHAIETDGYTRRDLIDAGATPHEARTAAEYAFVLNSPSIAVPTPPADANPVVALIASGALAQRLLDKYGIYLRARSLAQPVRRIATHLGTDHHQVVDEIRPIVARYIVASSTITAPTHPDPAIAAQIQAAWADPDLTSGDYWPEPADLFVLGDRLPDISVPLGYRGGIAGTRHHELATLLAAPQLVGLSSI